MKIILSNYRFFISGGPERYLFAVKSLLENNGHDIIPFSVRSSQNEQSSYSKYFLSQIDKSNSAYFHEYNLTIGSIFKIIARQFYSPEGFFKARKLAYDLKPDIVYSLHFLNKMSPSILDGFKSAGIPVVARISDFSLICPGSHLFTNGQPCEDCITKSIFFAIKNKCVQDSYIASLIKSMALMLHRVTGSYKKVDAWIFPSDFTMQKYINAGFEKEKLHYVPTFIDYKSIAPNFKSQKYFLYFGRICEEKGVHILLEEYNGLEGNKPPLLIIGDRNDSNYSRYLVSKYRDKVKFLNFLPKEQLYKYISESLIVIIPSLWYENLPNVLLESYANGKPVIGPDHGCLKRYILPEITGLLYKSSQAGALQNCLDWARNNPSKLRLMGKNARNFVETYHSPQVHYLALERIFKSIITNR